jgi:hypothetical protein
MATPQTGQWRTEDMGGDGVIIAPCADSAARLLMQINIHIGWAPARDKNIMRHDLSQGRHRLCGQEYPRNVADRDQIIMFIAMFWDAGDRSMSKQRMIAAALEDLYDSEDGGAEHPATLRRRISLAIQECWHDGVTLQELVDAVRRKMRGDAARH